MEQAPNYTIKKNCDLSVSECLHCVVLKEQLRSALEEVESTKLIIKLLKNEVEEGFPQDDRAVNPPSDMSLTVSSNGSANNKWTISTAKCPKKVSSTKKPAEVSLANRYEQLSNLQDSREGDTTSVTKGQHNTPEISHSNHLLNLQHQSRETTQNIDGKNRESEDDFQVYHIPTILKGKIENKNIEKVSNEVDYKNRENKKTKIQSTQSNNDW